jgi:DnaJ-class molecular chaperone
MLKTIKCHCGGRPSCKLCGGTQSFQYEAGPRGYLPFTCPTCSGKGWIEEPGVDREKCFTCRGNGVVDPADPPSHGFIDIIWKALFGA